MNVFVDYIGHGDLSYSMFALFEKRLGWNLYRPDLGPEWNDYKIQTGTLTNEISPFYFKNEIQHVDILIYPYTQKILTFDQFREMKIDIMITTTWANETPFCMLQKKYHPKSLLIRQIANIHEKPVQIKNLLMSTLEPMPSDVDYLIYHPEQVDLFFSEDPTFSFIIKSFSNYLTSYPEDLQAWNQYRTSLIDFEFRMHGAGSELHTVPSKLMPASMREAMFIWHTKAVGSCGYVLRQALASGKPCIVRKDYARIHNTLAQNLLQDGVNCIDIDPKVRSFNESLNLIREWSRPDVYPEKCEATIKKFKNDINFEEEAANIKTWILGKTS